MKSPRSLIAAAVASLLIASMGTIAYAQTPQPQQHPAHTRTTMSRSHHDRSMSSSEMGQKIKHELTSHGVTATHVKVSFRDGTATLSGTVFNQKDVAKAKKLAMRVHGVKHVQASALHARTKPGRK